MICAIRLRIVFLLGAALLAGCGASEDDASVPSNADRPTSAADLITPEARPPDATTPVSTARPKAVFVEVVFEIAGAPRLGHAGDPKAALERLACVNCRLTQSALRACTSGG